MNPNIITKLAELGYWTRYGGDGQLHIIRRSEFRRGAQACCGATASRRDYHAAKPACDACMKICMAEIEGTK